MYVEPFIVYRHSEIGRAKGDAWAGRWPGGALHMHYAEADSPTMVAAFGAWQEYITSVCERLVCLCGVDGIFLDSYGWQMNWPMETKEERRLYTPNEHVQGVLQLTGRVRNAIRRIKPDAVVLGETASGRLGVTGTAVLARSSRGIGRVRPAVGCCGGRPSDMPCRR